MADSNKGLERKSSRCSSKISSSTSQGIDITEAFEAYHIRDNASKVLTKFYVRDAVAERNYKLTFDDNGFYRSLKRRVAEKLESIDKSVVWKSTMILCMDLFLVFSTAVTAMWTENIFLTIAMLLVSGFFLACLNAIAHNFIHQRNNWQMYASNMSLVGWRDFRVFHGTVSVSSIILFSPETILPRSHITCILTPTLTWKFHC